jgi:hypothetical protein
MIKDVSGSSNFGVIIVKITNEEISSWLITYC